MAIFFVFQGQTYAEESEGEYVWSPTVNKRGCKNKGYEIMTEIRKGDFILHSTKSNICAISIAKNDCYEANQPIALKNAKTTVDWNDNGYRVDCKYYKTVLLPLGNYRKWLEENYINDSAFTKIGGGKQQYMCHLAEIHAIFLLESLISQQPQGEGKIALQNALQTINASSRLKK